MPQQYIEDAYATMTDGSGGKTRDHIRPVVKAKAT